LDAQSKSISVVKEMPESSVRISVDCTVDADGCNKRNGREYLFLNVNEDISHFELLDSEKNQGN